jgi:hypothetical protein
MVVDVWVSALGVILRRKLMMFMFVQNVLRVVLRVLMECAILALLITICIREYVTQEIVQKILVRLMEFVRMMWIVLVQLWKTARIVQVPSVMFVIMDFGSTMVHVLKIVPVQLTLPPTNNANLVKTTAYNV